MEGTGRFRAGPFPFSPGSFKTRSERQKGTAHFYLNGYPLLFWPSHSLVSPPRPASKTIPGAKFRIRAVNGSYGPQEFTTNGSGEIDLSMLPEGSYEVTEVECAGYVIDDAQRIIHLKANDRAEFVFTNTKKPGFKLFKTSAAGSPLDGVTFKITPIEDASHSIDRTTADGGEIFVEDLEPGVYSVVETATLPDHVLDKTEYHVELSPGKISELRLSNDKRPYLTISKVEQGTGKAIPGTKFRIEGINSDYQHDVTTGPDDTVKIQVDPGSYRITEKDVPEPYCLPEDEADRVQTVSLNPNDNKTLTFKNSKKPLLTLSKQAAGKQTKPPEPDPKEQPPAKEEVDPAQDLEYSIEDTKQETAGGIGLIDMGDVVGDDEPDEEADSPPGR